MAYRYKTIKVDGKTKLKHRHLVEQALDISLSPDVHVHHRNGDTHDNRLENLEPIDGVQHLQDHAEARRIYPRVKPCMVCGREFEPHRTKRKRAKTCSRPCANELRSRTERATKAKKKHPPMAEALVRANVVAPPTSKQKAKPHD